MHKKIVAAINWNQERKKAEINQLRRTFTDLPSDGDQEVITTTPKTVSIVIAGVGGQGNILIANVIGKATINARYKVKGTGL